MIKNKIKRKETKLELTPREAVRDSAIEKLAEVAYLAGNNTDKLVEIVGPKVDAGCMLVGGSESAGSLGRIAYKAGRDAARGDKVCTGLCLISATCETVALGCSAIPVIPFRGKIYIGAKIVSKGCMSFRNACAGEGC